MTKERLEWESKDMRYLNYEYGDLIIARLDGEYPKYDFIKKIDNISEYLNPKRYIMYDENKTNSLYNNLFPEKYNTITINEWVKDLERELSYNDNTSSSDIQIIYPYKCSLNEFKIKYAEEFI